jgi:hypothetical protein
MYFAKGREMSPQTARLSNRMPMHRRFTPSGRYRRRAIRAAGLLLISLWSVPLAHGAGVIGSPTPPPAPRVPPIISADDATDLNGNRINDALEASIGTPGGLSIASAPEPVAVELIFREPVTQRQIDDFLRLGGRITYLYQAVSYGWNGLIPPQKVRLLPAAMGPTLVQVEAVGQWEPYLDQATQVGRVRPVWKPGFAGSPIGFSGDPNTTIAFLGGGVDATHTDLQGRCLYWRDFTDENEPMPVDYDGHDTAVTSVAVGTGAAGGADAGALSYTVANAATGPWFWLEPICLPKSNVTMKMQASWGLANAQLCIARWLKGTDMEDLQTIGYCSSVTVSSTTLSFPVAADSKYAYGALLACTSHGYIDPSS